MDFVSLLRRTRQRLILFIDPHTIACSAHHCECCETENGTHISRAWQYISSSSSNEVFDVFAILFPMLRCFIVEFVFYKSSYRKLQHCIDVIFHHISNTVLLM